MSDTCDDTSSTTAACSLCATSLPKSDLTARLISGTIGSLVTSLLVTPLEVVKIRQQAAAAVGDASFAKSSPSTMSNVRPCPRGCGTFVFYNGHMDCILSKSWVSFFDPRTGKLRPNPSSTEVGVFGMIRRIFAQEGFPGLYAGLRPTLAMAVPNTVLYFSAYEEIVWRLRHYYDVTDGGIASIFIPLGSGASARFLSSTVTAPFELLRTRQAAETGSGMSPSRGMWQEFKYMTEHEGGVRTLFRGLKPTLYRDVPFSAIYWVSMEQFRGMWQQRMNRGYQPSPMEQAAQAFVNGALAGMIAAACTTPFDVIKTRQQAKSLDQIVLETSGIPNNSTGATICHHDGLVAFSSTSRADTVTENTWTYLRHIARTEGISALWKGNQARMLKVAPSCAIMISSYELGKRFLQPESMNN